MTIVSALEARNIPLLRIGESKYKLCCPVHTDTHPSAVLNPYRGKWRFHCFACGHDCDDVDLLVAMGATPGEAMRALRPPRDPSKPLPEPVYASCPVKSPCDCDGPFGCQSCTYAPGRYAIEFQALALVRWPTVE